MKAKKQRKSRSDKGTIRGPMKTDREWFLLQRKAARNSRPVLVKLEEVTHPGGCALCGSPTRAWGWLDFSSALSIENLIPQCATCKGMRGELAASEFVGHCRKVAKR